MSRAGRLTSTWRSARTSALAGTTQRSFWSNLRWDYFFERVEEQARRARGSSCTIRKRGRGVLRRGRLVAGFSGRREGTLTGERARRHLEQRDLFALGAR